ncbi:Enoyl-CoA hydratase [Burkholderiales bacterium 8X]|nr:Enoyl-CoA hydratase [Burkholderiales bacterium 8X]
MTCPERPADPRAHVLCWRESGVAHLRFNRPEALNAIDERMAKEFLGACQTIAADEEVRVVWMSGEGRAFMAGGDVAAMHADPQGASALLIEGMHGGMRVLDSLATPIIASVHGAVAGGGMGVMLQADLVLAAAGTRFTMAYPLIGASCDCSTSWGLPRILGLRQAMEFALLSEAMAVEEALRLGLINRVIAADELHAEAARWAKRLADGPTEALRQIKRLLRASMGNDLDRQLDAEAQAFARCAATQDFVQGVEAFLGKKRPAFMGR